MTNVPLGMMDAPRHVSNRKISRAAAQHTLCGVRFGRRCCCSARCRAFLGGDWPGAAAAPLASRIEWHVPPAPHCFARHHMKQASLPSHSRRHRRRRMLLLTSDNHGRSRRWRGCTTPPRPLIFFFFHASELVHEEKG